MIYYHFLREDRRLGFNDGRKVRVGETLTVYGKPIHCRWGLHANRRVIDALDHAPGPILEKVTLGGTVVHVDGCSVATERTTIAIVDCTDILRAFARRCRIDARAATWADGMDDTWVAAVARATAWGDAKDDAWADARASAWSAATRAFVWADARAKQNRRLMAMLRRAPWE